MDKDNALVQVTPDDIVFVEQELAKSLQNAHVIVSELERQIVANIHRKEREASILADRLIQHMIEARAAA